MGKKRKSLKKNFKFIKKKRRPGGKRRWKLWQLRVNRFELAVTMAAVLLAFFIIRNNVIKSLIADHPKDTALLQSQSAGDSVLPAEEGPCGRPEIRQSFIEPNEYSRSQISLRKVRGVVIHYVANPGSTAKDNRDYFESLKDTHATKASSHFIVGLSGEIIQCIPLNEISYASNHRNKDTISIECCHPEADGRFNDETYRSLVKLTAWLCAVYDLDSGKVIRHYDVTGKLCPLYYVKNEDAWIKLRKNIQNHLDKQE